MAVKNRSVFFLLLLMGLAVSPFSSCQMAWTPKSPKGYVMPRPEKIVLEKKLNEISGLFYLQDEQAFLAIADDKKKVFRISLDGRKVSDYFKENIDSEQLDYEDVLKLGSTVYVLVSDGSIMELNKTDSGFQVIRHPFWSTEKNDFETLYYDEKANGLIIVCKQCAFEKGTKQRMAFRFDLSTRSFDREPFYAIEIQEVMDRLKDGKVDFHPSAATIHPLDGRLYMLASAGNLMVVLDLNGRVESAYRLNPTLYPQAEGIAFATNGDMYISNEAKLGKPTLLKIAYNPSRK